MKVNEIFHSIQGEGSSIGIPSIFVRLAGCNIACSFCDSKYALADEFKELDIFQIMGEIRKFNCTNVVITGGEPLIQFDELRELCSILKLNGYTIEIETNGTIAPGILMASVERWHVSIKLNNSGVSENDRIVAKTIEKFGSLARMGSDVEFKFVVGKKDDFVGVLYIIGKYKIPRENVTIMPCAISREGVLKLMEEFASPCMDHRIRLLPRLHVLIWGNKRAV